MNRIIDVHSHYVPKGWPDPTGGSGRLPWLKIESEAEAVIMIGSRQFRRIRSNSWDAGVRLAEMDSDGVDAQVVMPTPVFFSYTEEPVQAAASPGCSMTWHWRSARRHPAGSCPSARSRSRTPTPPAGNSSAA